jgi:hypothetical protein
MTIDFGTHFLIEDLRAAILWSKAQGPWGAVLEVVASHKRYGEVLEVFGPGGIIPRWRLYMEGERIRLTDHLGVMTRFATLKDALLSIAPVPGESDFAQDQVFPD